MTQNLTIGSTNVFGENHKGLDKGSKAGFGVDVVAGGVYNAIKRTKLRIPSEDEFIKTSKETTEVAKNKYLQMAKKEYSKNMSSVWKKTGAIVAGAMVLGMAVGFINDCFNKKN